MRTALLAALLLSVAPAAARVGRAAPADGVGARAPRFNLPARGGEAALDSLDGHVVVVDFWASWCAPCQHSFPWLGQLARKYAANGLRVVAINLDKSRPAADQFLMRNAVPFAVAFDPAGKTAEAYHVSAMPSTALVGADGTLLAMHRGFTAKEAGALEGEIRAALGLPAEVAQ